MKNRLIVMTMAALVLSGIVLTPASATAQTPAPGAAATPVPAPPKEWIERAYNLRRHTVMPAGGHFAALEEPDRLVEDIRAFYRPLRFGAAND